jgi:hypothetical protein
MALRSGDPMRPLRGLVLLLGLLSAGCGPVLTRPQTAAVADFGTASKACSGLPGSVLRAYEDVHTADSLFTASTAETRDARLGLEAVKRSLRTSDALKKKAEQLDKAAGFLAAYSEALTRLASDDQLKTLDADAGDLGKALDGAVAEYNKLPRVTEPLQPFGAAAAAAVRGVGGILVRVKQARYLRRFVEDADPAVQKLAGDLTGLMRELGSEQAEGVSFSAEAAKLETNFLAYFSLRPGFLDHGDVEAFAAAMAKAQAGRELAVAVAASTVKLAKAHQALVAAVRPEASRQERLEELRSLVDQIKAAQSLQKKLEAK